MPTFVCGDHVQPGGQAESKAANKRVRKTDARLTSPDTLFRRQPADQGSRVLLDRIQGLLQIANIRVVVGPHPS